MVFFFSKAYNFLVTIFFFGGMMKLLTLPLITSLLIGNNPTVFANEHCKEECQPRACEPSDKEAGQHKSSSSTNCTLPEPDIEYLTPEQTQELQQYGQISIGHNESGYPERLFKVRLVPGETNAAKYAEKQRKKGRELISYTFSDSQSEIKNDFKEGIQYGKDSWKHHYAKTNCNLRDEVQRNENSRCDDGLTQGMRHVDTGVSIAGYGLTGVTLGALGLGAGVTRAIVFPAVKVVVYTIGGVGRYIGGGIIGPLLTTPWNYMTHSFYKKRPTPEWDTLLIHEYPQDEIQKQIDKRKMHS